MEHKHGAEAEKCSCGCNGHHHGKSYVYLPFYLDHSPIVITASGINWTCFLVVWGMVAFGLYGGGSGVLESVLIAPVVILTVVAVLIAAVAAVVWLFFAVKKALCRSNRGIRQDKVTYEYLYEGKKQKSKSKWSEASLILFLTIAMVLCLLLDRIYF